MMRLLLATGAVLALLVSGCSETEPPAANEDKIETTGPDWPTLPPRGTKWNGMPGERVYPNPTCLLRLEEASQIVDSEQAEPALRKSLYACRTAEEWLSGIEMHPGAIGATEGYQAELIDIQSACHRYKRSPVCRDAADKGIKLP